ncbi:GntR family transcriptional regulator [Mycetocola reblochoni]|uniref:GntR family transcriptional regulator n=1 Tax=Mycetocola reblochoni TaxID=331618 RepID=A0A3L6ZIY1_9MICO|nr:GntR family transcriptional regulator [Mycetocola reblochoni]RLP67817.1 GntR family transcriptional regulator [Mycetocola reblochoni]
MVTTGRSGRTRDSTEREAHRVVATGDKTERVYEHVVARHLRGEYAPGDKLVIARLAEATGVSAVPVREALRRLEADGIVEYTHQRGFRARSLDPDEVVEALEAHGAIEAVAVALAVPRLGPEVVVGLREANALMRTAVADGDEAGFAEASLAFHRRGRRADARAFGAGARGARRGHRRAGGGGRP